MTCAAVEQNVWDPKEVQTTGASGSTEAFGNVSLIQQRTGQDVHVNAQQKFMVLQILTDPLLDLEFRVWVPPDHPLLK